jgi:acyl-CoA hydrolase
VLDLSMRQCARAMETGAIAIKGALLTAVRWRDNLALVPATDLAVIAFERARYRAVEVLARWDHQPAGPSFSVADVDYLVDGSGIPAMAAGRPATGTERRIGELVADLVPRGATMELGVGRALTAVAECLIGVGRPLAIHTGLASDWTQQLVEGGVATAPQECANSKPILAAVAMGTQRFTDWMSGSEALVFADSRHAHDPCHLAGLRPFVAINSAMAVDLCGQVGLFNSAPEAYPPGGLLDFAIAGAYGGRSIIALTSQARDGRSRIVSELTAVHLPRGLVSHVVTEYGVADLRGRSASERRTAMLQITHPDHRVDVAQANAFATRDRTRHV